MAKFRSNWGKEVLDAVDCGIRRTVINTQSKLVAASPISSGRLASSWMVGKNQPDESERGEDWAPPGAKRVEIARPKSETINAQADWYISNAVPYAYRSANDPYQGRRGGGDWYSRIENSLERDLNREIKICLRKVK